MGTLDGSNVLVSILVLFKKHVLQCTGFQCYCLILSELKGRNRARGLLVDDHDELKVLSRYNFYKLDSNYLLSSRLLSKNQNCNCLYFHVSPSAHSISCVRSCRTFVNLLTSSAGFVGCQHPKRPEEDINKLTKGLQERTQLIEWDDGEILKQR